VLLDRNLARIANHLCLTCVLLRAFTLPVHHGSALSADNFHTFQSRFSMIVNSLSCMLVCRKMTSSRFVQLLGPQGRSVHSVQQTHTRRACTASHETTGPGQKWQECAQSMLPRCLLAGRRSWDKYTQRLGRHLIGGF
jgi:hypothetical protein